MDNFELNRISQDITHYQNQIEGLDNLIRQLDKSILLQTTDVEIAEKQKTTLETRQSERREYEIKLKESQKKYQEFCKSSNSNSLHNPVPVKSFYLTRPEITDICLQEINKNGGFLRIKGANRMGKTSLITQILSLAKNHNHLTVYLSLRSANKKQAVLEQLGEFLIWFCNRVITELNKQGINVNLLTLKKDSLFDDKYYCADLFEKNVLSQINRKLILFLDDIDYLYKTEIDDDFFELLRQFHEKSKFYSEIWGKICFVIAYSNSKVIHKIYISPLNVGTQIELIDFDSKEILQLAQLYRVDINDNQLNYLQQKIGGSPSLIQTVFEQSCLQKITLEDFIDRLFNNPEIYDNLLLQALVTLEGDLELKEAMKIIVNSPHKIRLDLNRTLELERMGLIKRVNDEVTVRSELYRQYFQKHL